MRLVCRTSLPRHGEELFASLADAERCCRGESQASAGERGSELLFVTCTSCASPGGVRIAPFSDDAFETSLRGDRNVWYHSVLAKCRLLSRAPWLETTGLAAGWSELNRT